MLPTCGRDSGKILSFFQEEEKAFFASGRKSGVQVLTLLLIGCMTLDKSLYFSELQFPIFKRRIILWYPPLRVPEKVELLARA